MTPNDSQAGFSRNHYITGRLLNAADFQREQDYQNGKRQLINRCLFGARVACGLEVEIVKGWIHINRGLALDCGGNEVYLPESTKLALPDKDGTYYLHLLYKEIMTVPIPGLYSQDASDEIVYSIIQESCELSWGRHDSMTEHPWKNDAWKPCGEAHALTIAKLNVNNGTAELDREFAARIAAGRTGW